MAFVDAERTAFLLAAEAVDVGLVPTLVAACGEHPAGSCYRATMWTKGGGVWLDELHAAPTQVLQVFRDYRVAAVGTWRNAVMYRMECAAMPRGCSTPALTWALPGDLPRGAAAPEMPAGWLAVLQAAGWVQDAGGLWVCPGHQAPSLAGAAAAVAVERRAR